MLVNKAGDMTPTTDAYSFTDETKRFCETYLFTALENARDADERPEVALFALLECVQMLIAVHADSNEQAMDHFKGVVDAYLRDWAAST